MAETPTRTVSSRNQCRVVQPAVRAPTPRALAPLEEADRSLLLKLFEEPAEYVHHELFAKSRCERLLFGDKAVLSPESTSFEESDGDPFPDPLGTTLTTTKEILLFQRFNYTRMQIARLMKKYRGKRMPSAAMCQLLAWAHRSMTARAQIVQANLPLVLAMAKRTRLNGLDFNELISEGNLALLRSVDKFDCSRGFKFSTYACRAILKSFSRVAMRTSRYRGRFPAEFDPALEKSDYVDRKREGVESDCVDDIRDIMAQNRASLNDIEHTVICERFALDADTMPPKGKTLEQVGEIIGVTKERVRQIQNKALAKIRMILEEDYLAA